MLDFTYRGVDGVTYVGWLALYRRCLEGDFGTKMLCDDKRVLLLVRKNQPNVHISGITREAMKLVLNAYLGVQDYTHKLDDKSNRLIQLLISYSDRRDSATFNAGFEELMARLTPLNVQSCEKREKAWLDWHHTLDEEDSESSLLNGATNLRMQTQCGWQDNRKYNLLSSQKDLEQLFDRHTKARKTIAETTAHKTEDILLLKSLLNTLGVPHIREADGTVTEAWHNDYIMTAFRNLPTYEFYKVMEIVRQASISCIGNAIIYGAIIEGLFRVTHQHPHMFSTTDMATHIRKLGLDKLLGETHEVTVDTVTNRIVNTWNTSCLSSGDKEKMMTLEDTE